MSHRRAVLQALGSWGIILLGRLKEACREIPTAVAQDLTLNDPIKDNLLGLFTPKKTRAGKRKLHPRRPRKVHTQRPARSRSCCQALGSVPPRMGS